MRIKEQDNKLLELEKQNNELRSKVNTLSRKSEDAEELKLKIGDILIKTQQHAENILEEAKREARSR